MSRAKTKTPQIQHHSDTGWTVARSPLTRHAYLVQHRGADVGWVLREDDGWRWLLTWSVRPLRHGVERTSRRSYRTWQTAVGGLARTDGGLPHHPAPARHVAAAHRPPVGAGGRSVTRVLAFALTILVLASSTVVPPTASSAPTTSTAMEQQPCDWQETFHATLGMLGEEPGDWRVRRMDGYAGQVDPESRLAVVNPEIPCGYVETVVVHEWLHLRQIDRYGSWQAAKKASGGQLDAELVAECGVALLAAPEPGRHSYASESRRTRGYGCTSWHVLEAAGLIAETAASTNEPPN